MKIKLMLLLLIVTLISAGFKSSSEKMDGLPFVINYSLPLKIISQASMEKYDYTEYATGEDILQLKHYRNHSKDKAKKMIEDRKFFILAMFQDQPSPYPGILSNNLGCPKELQPRAIEDTVAVSLYFKLFATSNLIYGNCNINDNHYHCLYSIFFCPVKQELFELKIFTPIKKPSFDYKTFSPAIRCKD